LLVGYSDRMLLARQVRNVRVGANRRQGQGYDGVGLMSKDNTNIRVVHTSDPEATLDVVEDSLAHLWKAVDDLSRIRPPKQEFYRVTIFGSARMLPGDRIYQKTRRLAAMLTDLGADIVTGGGPGLMQAANEGAALGDSENQTRSFGLPIELPHEEEANPFVEEIYRHRTFFTRLHRFVRLSSAFIIVPGGIGTTLELMMIWQLCQVKHIRTLPLIAIGEMWSELVEWGRDHMLSYDPPLAAPEDLELLRCVADVDEAVAIIEQDIRVFNE